mmetsp:Transcript_15012/g.28253  ORF Transcript_15012/g.28253 Transcript_15012/m.28253 type:complete len:241 (-) Transcript_15012:609-1331(-)
MFLSSSSTKLLLIAKVLWLVNSAMGQKNVTKMGTTNDLLQDISIGERIDYQNHKLIVLPYYDYSDIKNETMHSDNRSFFLRKKRHLSNPAADNKMTLDYGPGGWCGLCGKVDEYSCDKGIHSVSWNDGVRTFQDPTVCGATFVKATVYGGDLGAVSLRFFLNDMLIGEQKWQGSPFCDTCTSAVFESAISSSSSSSSSIIISPPRILVVFVFISHDAYIHDGTSRSARIIYDIIIMIVFL